MSCWRAAVYGLGLSQVFLMMGAELMYPPAWVQTWVYWPRVENGTLVHAAGGMRATPWGLELPCMAVAAAAAFFVSNSYGLSESGRLPDECAFCQEAVAELGLWDTVFWVTVALNHLIVLSMACSPGDLYLVLGATYLLVASLWTLCRPREARDGEQPPPDSARLTYNVLGCLCGLGLAAAGVPEGYPDRNLLLFGLAILDYFLGIGHVWERVPTMETVLNCRVFHACFSAVNLAVVYSAWHEHLQLPARREPDASGWYATE
jgi:hypothetical protein